MIEMFSPIAQTREEERGVCGCCGCLLRRCPSTENLLEGDQEAYSASRGDLADAQAEGPGPRSQGSSQLMTEHSRETRTGAGGPGFHPLAETSSVLERGLRFFLPPSTSLLFPRGQAHPTGGASLPFPESLSFWSCTSIFPNKPLAHFILSWQLLSRKLKLTEVCRVGHPLGALCFIIITYFYYLSNLQMRQFSSHCTEEDTKHDRDEQLAPQS